MYKKLFEKRNIAIILLCLISVLLFLSYYSFSTSRYLHFSDAAKFADIARNVLAGNGYKANFSFFSSTLFGQPQVSFFSARGVPVAMQFAISLAFRFFGPSDFSVILTSGIFYLGLVVSIYLLARKLFGNLVGFLSSLAVAANINFLDYATSGASETLFSFLAVLAAYLILLKRKWSNILAFGIFVMLYLTRPQGFLFIVLLLFMWLAINFSVKKAVLWLFLFVMAFFAVDRFILYPLSFKIPVYPIFIRGLQAFFQYSSNFAISDALRGGLATNVTILGILKKTFYNLYNFYKLMPQIMSPYMFGLFVLGLFWWKKDKFQNIFKFTSLAILLASLLMVALTIPFFRYIHPVIPFVYICAVGTLVWIIETIFKEKKYLVGTASLILILFFIVGQTLGAIFLDSRSVNKALNSGKPPVYVVLSKLLRENTSPSDVVVTNLDTWGSWYGERKTVWFPLTPEMLSSENKTLDFDAIFLTSYLMDDENYYMGPQWRQAFESPQKIDDKYLSQNFKVKGVFTIKAEEDYENQSARAVLLVKK
ncbi:glycosyltransferase family 39 protein [Patescibacteria group bacterium]|nr:glycosyltransferase family 39 protein [Patescibacteria group bacterium]